MYISNLLIITPSSPLVVSIYTVSMAMQTQLTWEADFAITTSARYTSLISEMEAEFLAIYRQSSISVIESVTITEIKYVIRFISQATFMINAHKYQEIIITVVR